MNDDEYDAAADFAGSIAECYRAIRERIARGGPPWVPPTVDVPQQPAEMAQRAKRDRAA